MNLAEIDLNLLVAFEALFIEKSVTRAGRRIGLAQPSMSNTLVRMRELFADELFLRTPNGMVPTQRALEIAPSIIDALTRVRRVFEEGQPFEPLTAERCFTASVSDYSNLVLMPHVIAALRTQAPGIDLRIKPLSVTAFYEELENGDADLAIGGHLPVPVRHVGVDLFYDKYVCVVDPENSVITSGLSLDAYANMPHLMFSRDGTFSGVADEALSAFGLRRRVAIVLPHVMAVPFAIRGTDLVAMIAERVAQQFRNLAGVSVLPLPIDVPSFSLKLVYSKRFERDPGLAWIVRFIREVASGL